MITDRNTTNLRTGTTAEECGRRVRSDAESQAIARELQRAVLLRNGHHTVYNSSPGL